MPVTTDPSRVLKQNPKVFSTAVGNEVALMSVERGRYYSLNPVASDIWKRLAEPMPASELTNALVRDYEGDATQIENDVHELIGKLTGEGLIEAHVAPVGA